MSAWGDLPAGPQRRAGPPLPSPVPPGPPLSDAERQRWARHLSLPGFGERAQRSLRAARVAVVGAGGLGSPVLTYLAAAGVGALVVIDDDTVETSNLQRQVLHGVEYVGRLKVASAAASLARTAPWTRVHAVAERLTDATADHLLAGCDVVVDGADNFTTRYAVADACSRLGAPEVFGSLLGFDAQVGAFWGGPPDDPGPRWPTYRDVFPHPPPAGSVTSCEDGGVLGALCGVVGSVMAVEVLKLLTGTGTPLLGRHLVLDALAMAWREVVIKAQPAPAASATEVGERSTAPAPQPLPQEAVLTPASLASALAAREDVLLIDVRTAAERSVSVLAGALAVPLDAVLAGHLPDGASGRRRVVVYCRSGARSARAVAALRAAGVLSAAHLDGGLQAWAAQIDPQLPVG